MDLISLHIKDFAIIDSLDVEFGPGLNIMTGETGAGKTIVVEALKLVLGSRASTEVIRTGKEEARVSAVFDVKNISANLMAQLEDAGITIDGELVIHRVVANQGKGKIAVNGVPVAAVWLKNFAEHLADISSQHEHQILLDPKEHAAILDLFGNFPDISENYRDAHRKWAGLSREIDELESARQGAKDKLDFLKFQLKELSDADLKEGEDVAIEAERTKLKHASQLEEKIRGAEAVIYGNEGSALEGVDRAIQLVTQCASFDSETLKWAQSMQRARTELNESARDMVRYVESLAFDPNRLEELDERNHLIRELARKHGGSIESCLLRKEKIAAEIDTIENYDDVLQKKNGELEKISGARRTIAERWRQLREKAAGELGAIIAKELYGLGMAKIELVVRVSSLPEEEWDELGPHLVEFLFSPNVGEPLRPVARIASGGELSRVMLAVKGALAKKVSLGSVSVFDEVDSGIGGATAAIVGKKLKQLSGSRQVICITHLPQVAVFGDRHFRISKNVRGGRTVAEIIKLPEGERVNEIARMLGSEKITDTTITHAREMLACALD